MASDSDNDIGNALAFAKSFLKGQVLINDVRARKEDAPRVYEALEKAAVNPDTNDFDALIALAALLLRERAVMLPPILANFAADVIEGKRKRPTRRGADKYRTWVRDYKLYRAVQEVARAFHLPHYSNNELSSNVSAAQIVSQAAACKLSAVVRAYKRMKAWGQNNPRNSTPRL